MRVHSPLVASTGPADDGRLTSIRGMDYLGSHPSAPEALDRMDLVFTTSGVVFERRGEMLATRPWSDVVDLAVDGTVTTRRPSLLRYVVFGFVAWIFQLRTDLAIVRVQLRDGAWVFGVDDLSVSELRAGFARLDPYYREA